MPLNYHRVGTGPTLVLIHGIGSHWQVWKPVLDRFERSLHYATLIAPKLTIQGGTREVLRGVIARGLGLR